MIRVALLSKWHVHAAGYAKQFASIPDVQITVVWDEDPIRGKEWADELGCAYEPSLEKALAREDVDAVSVCTATGMHKEVITAAARAGKAVFTEKVLSFTAKEAQEIADVIHETGVPFLISLRRRTEKRLVYVKKMLDEGVIGQITHLRVRDAHDGASSGWLPPTFFDIKQCGGGAMMDLGAHPMYLCLYFLGEPKKVSSTFTEMAGKGADDNCISVLEYENGAIATSETAFVSKKCPFSLEINGTGGSIFVSDLFKGEIYLSTGDGVRKIEEAEMGEDLLGPVPLFVDCLRNKKAMPFTVEDAVALSRLMEAAYKSAAAGVPVLY
ncbi:MAG: Gfo/Idh/MocA family protein [Candidatus Merdivicinus sp.]